MTKADILKKMKSGVITLLHVNKYIIVLVIGVVVVGFLGENSVVAHLHNQRTMNQLREEIASYKATTEANVEQTRRMMKDVKAVEQVAREQHFMRAEDEDVFVLSDDDPTPQSTHNHETVE